MGNGVSRARPGEGLEFIRRAAASSTDNCVLWPFHTSKSPTSPWYRTPRVWFEDKMRPATHVVMKLLGHQRVPGMEICHSCHEPRCLNPRQTRRENMDDLIESGHRKGKRAAWGEQHGGSKLTDEDVMAIRETYANGGVSQASLAKSYNVSQSLICGIVQRKRWNHLP